MADKLQDAYTDKSGVVHPIRKSEGYAPSKAHEVHLSDGGKKKVTELTAQAKYEAAKARYERASKAYDDAVQREVSFEERKKIRDEMKAARIARDDAREAVDETFKYARSKDR